MKSIKIDLPEDWPYVHLYVLADLHIGDPLCDEREIDRRIDIIKRDPYAVVILNGDLMNTATRTGVSDVYGEVLSPMQQIDHMVKLLTPIKDKLIAADTGNHESRIYKDSGIDTMAFACRELGIYDRYCGEGVLVFIRFGRKPGHGRHRDQSQRQWYPVYATHGSGGGRKEGAKAIRLADMACVVSADVYIHSHTHTPMAFPLNHYRSDPNTCSAKEVSALHVNTDATLTYGGYGQRGEFKPAARCFYQIVLTSGHKHAYCVPV